MKAASLTSLTSVLASSTPLLVGQAPLSTVGAAPPDTAQVTGQSLSMPVISTRCTAGYVRYRRSDWGCDPNGTITTSVVPTSSAEWVYLSDGSSVTFHAPSEPDEQRRINGRTSLFVNARTRVVTLVDGQHSPSQEGIDELLIGCEGLAEGPGAETLAEEMALAEIQLTERAGGCARVRYRLPGEADGWLHEIEWVEGPSSRVTAQSLFIPAVDGVGGCAGTVRVVRSEVIDWQWCDGLLLPKAVERTVSLMPPNSTPTLLGRSRFEVLERRERLTAVEQTRVGPLHIDNGWSVVRLDTACAAVIGDREFTFCGRRYESADPVTLGDLARPLALLENARCLEQ